MEQTRNQVRTFGFTLTSKSGYLPRGKRTSEGKNKISTKLVNTNRSSKGRLVKGKFNGTVVPGRTTFVWETASGSLGDRLWVVLGECRPREKFVKRIVNVVGRREGY